MYFYNDENDVLKKRSCEGNFHRRLSGCQILDVKGGGILETSLGTIVSPMVLLCAFATRYLDCLSGYLFLAVKKAVKAL